jgi:hypothetical protein
MVSVSPGVDLAGRSVTGLKVHMLEAKPLGACGVVLALAGCSDFAKRHEEPMAVRNQREIPVFPRPLLRDPRNLDSARDAGADAQAEAANTPPVTAQGDAALPQSPVAEAGDSCSGGIAYGASCYRVSTAAVSWDAAQSDCASWSGALVRIDDAEADSFVAGLSEQSSWIGASDRAQAGDFRWTDGQDVQFANWGVAQPDGFPEQDCVEKREEPGEFWYDQECELAKFYVCERALEAH